MSDDNAPSDAEKASTVDLEQLDAQIEQHRTQKRWSDVVRLLVQKADQVPEQPDLQIQCWMEAGKLAEERNALEAIRCFERVLEVRSNDEDAVGRLRELYQRRRDWEKLVALLRNEAEEFQGEARMDRLVEIGDLATQRLRKPDLCIELWNEVLDAEPRHERALRALAPLHERARQWEPLAQVMEGLVEISNDPTEQVQSLHKLGLLYSDKLENEARAMETFERVLVLAPEDRRAQEQLKRRQIALGRWDDLETLFSQQGRWDELIRVLEREAESADRTQEEKVALLFRVARLWNEEREKPERAMRAYEKVLQVDDSNLDAADRLLEIYREGRDPRKLAQVLEVKRVHTEDEAQQIQLLEELLALYNDRLRDPSGALRCQLSLLALEPERAERVEALASLAPSAEDGWAQLVDRLPPILGAESAPSGDLALDLGTLLAQALQHTGDTDNAIDQYQGVLQQQPERIGVYGPLAELLRQPVDEGEQVEAGSNLNLERSEQLAQTLQGWLDNDPDGENRRPVLLELGQLQARTLSQPERAVETLVLLLGQGSQEQQAEQVDLDGIQIQAFELLAALYEESSRWAELAALLEQRVNVRGASNEDEQITLQARLAQVHVEHLADPRSGVAVLQAIASQGELPDTSVQLLEALLQSSAAEGSDTPGDSEPKEASEETREAASQLLDAVYEAQERHDERLTLHRSMADRASSPEAVAWHLRVVATLLDTQQEDVDGALAAWQQSIEADPSNDDALSEYLAFAEQRDRLEQVTEQLSSLAKSSGSEGATAAHLWRAVGRLRLEKLEDAQGATEAFMHARSLNPDDVQNLQSLANLLEQFSRWEELKDVLTSLASAQEDSLDRVDVLLRRARVEAHSMGDRATAIETLGVLTAVPDVYSEEAFDELIQLLDAESRHGEMVETLSRMIEETPDMERALELQLNRAKVQHHKLDAAAAALADYAGILESEPTHSDVTTQLEMLLDQAAPQEKKDAAQLLVQVYGALEDAARLASVYLRLADVLEDPNEIEDALDQAAELQENQLKDLSAAFETRARWFALRPDSLPGRSALEGLAESLNKWGELIAQYNRVASSSDSTTEVALSSGTRAELFSRAGELAHSRLNDPALAIENYESALGCSDNPLEILEVLTTLYVSTGDRKGQARVLEHTAEASQDPTTRVQSWMGAAKIHAGADQESGQGDVSEESRTEAIRLLQLARGEDPENLEILDFLCSLYQGSGDVRSLVEVLQSSAQVDPEPDGQITRWMRVSQLLQDSPDLPEEPEHPTTAVHALEQVLNIDPTHSEALQGLALLHREAESWEPLLEVLDKQLQVEDSKEKQIEIHGAMASLLHRKLNDTPRAIDIYRDILSEESGHQESVDALHEIALERAHRSLAMAVLEPELTMAANWERLIQIHTQVVDAEQVGTRAGNQDALQNDSTEEDADLESGPVPEPQDLEESLRQQRNAMTRIAEIQELELNDQAAAYDAWVHPSLFQPTEDSQLLKLQQLAEATGRFPDLVQRVGSHADALEDDILKGDLFETAATLSETKADDVAQAITWLEKAVQLDPERSDAQTALERLYNDQARWDDLIGLLEGRAEHAAYPEDALDLQCHIGRVLLEKKIDLDGAIGRYERVLQSAPEHELARTALLELFARGVEVVRIAQILEPLYRAEQQWDQVLHVLETWLGAEESPEQRQQLLAKLVRVADEKLADPELTFAWVQRALLEDPRNDQWLGLIKQLGDQLGCWPDVAETFAAALNVVEIDADAPSSVEDDGSSHIPWGCGWELAQVYLGPLGDMERAEATCRRLLAWRDTDEVLALLDKLYSERNMHEPLIEVLKRRTAHHEDSRDVQEFQYRTARALFQGLGKADEAARLLESDPTGSHPAESYPEGGSSGEGASFHLGSTRILQSIYAQRQDAPKLFQFMELERDHTSGDAARADVVARMAHVAWHQLGDAPRATELWNQVLELRGEDREALNALGDIHASQENWQDLKDVLERESAVVDDEQQRAAVDADLARLLWKRLDRPDRALECFERVLDVDPTHREALFSMADIHQGAGRHHEQVDAINRIVDACGDHLSSVERAHLHMELGWLYSTHLEQPMDAVEAYRSLLDQDPNHTLALDAMEFIQRQEQMWDDCLETMEKRIATMESSEQQCLEYRRAFDLCVVSLQDASRGVSYLEGMLSINAYDPFAFEALQEIYQTEERWEDLISLFLDRYEVSESTPERTGLLRECAHLYNDQMGDAEQAFEALRIAWTEDFTDNAIADELERFAATTQSWNVLLETANETLQTEQDIQVRIAICLRCARWYGQRLGRPDYALPYYQQVLSMDPASVPAMRQMAELHKQAGEWQTYSEALLRLVDMAQDPAEKAEIYVELGDLYEQQFSQMERAVAMYRAALDHDPKSHLAMHALERLYDESEQWAALLEILQSQLSLVETQEDGISIRLRMAQAHEYRIRDMDGAIQAYEQVRQMDPGNGVALKGLERLYSSQEKWAELLDILEAELQRSTIERERVDILERQATLWEEQFLKPERAVQCLERLVEEFPQHVEGMARLSHLYRTTRQWDSLVENLEQRVSLSTARAEKVQLHRELGQVWVDHMGKADRAIDALLDALNLDENDPATLVELARAYGQDNDHGRAAETWERVIALTPDPAERVELLMRLGQLFEQQLNDELAALDKYEAVLALDSTRMDALAAVRRINEQRQDWPEVVRILEMQIQSDASEHVRARLHVELGTILRDQLQDRDAGLRAFEAALELDRRQPQAAYPVAMHYVEHERWEEAFPLLDLLVRQGASQDGDEQEMALMLGEAARHLANHEAAVRAFERAHQMDATDLRALQGLADAHFAAGNWEQTFKFYQLLLSHHRDSLAPTDLAEVYYHLALARREQGDRRKAVHMLEKAVEVDAYHEPSLQVLVGVHTESQSWDQVVHYKRQLLETWTDEQKRFETLIEIGDTWKDHIQNRAKASEAYTEARALRPDDHQVLHRLLDCYQKTRQWDHAIEIIEAIRDMDSRPEAKSKYTYTMAVVLRDELKDPDAALERFNEALDQDPTQLKAFEAINRLHTEQRQWKELERAYRKMLHRVVGKGNADLEFDLWHNLGIIYRDRQNNLAAAAESFEMASQIKPDNAREHGILAELYERVPDSIERAIEHHQWILRSDPYNVEPYRALYRLYFQARAYDKAWCLAAALTFLKKADSEQHQFFEQYRPKGTIKPRARLDNELWVKHVFHPGEDLYVSKILEALAPAVYQLRATSDRALKLQKKHLVDPQQSTATFARTFGFVSQVFNVPTVPRLFLRSDLQGGLSHVVGSHPPALVCGASLLSGFSPQDLAFVVGRQLAYFRPEHIVRTMITTHTELKTLLLAGLRIGGVGPDDPEVEKTAANLSSALAPTQLEALRAIAKRFVDEGAQANVKRWMQLVDVSCCRAGLLASSDLESSVKMVQSLPAEGPTDLPPKDKVTELVLFSVSESYFQLREALGIQISV